MGEADYSVCAEQRTRRQDVPGLLGAHLASMLVGLTPGQMVLIASEVVGVRRDGLNHPLAMAQLMQRGGHTVGIAAVVPELGVVLAVEIAFGARGEFHQQSEELFNEFWVWEFWSGSGSGMALRMMGRS
jgi:hypothetical protein